jgi:hypothetical protein
MAKTDQTNKDDGKKEKVAHELILPLEVDPNEDKLSKEDSLAFYLRTTPSDKDSTTYKFTMRVLRGTESVRTIIKWFADVDKVLHGLNITDVAPTENTIISALTENALTSFIKGLELLKDDAQQTAIDNAADDAAKAAEKAKDPDTYKDVMMVLRALRMVVDDLLPLNALRRAKRDLRRNIKKPTSMKVRQFYANITRINSQEIPLLPPFHDSQKLPDEEIVDILMYSCPRAWTNEAERQGKDLTELSSHNVVRFFEQIEAAELFDLKKKKEKQNKNNNEQNPSKKKVKFGKNTTSNGNGKSNGNGGKYCLLHGKCGHTSNECKNLKSQAD